MFIRNKEDGFSLIEIALGLMILGIAMGTMTDTYFIYRQQQLRNITLQNAQEIQDALQKYVLNNGAYPAPADPGVNSANINFGVETAAALAAIPACAPGALAVCQTPAAAGTAGPGPILIGDVPFATLGLPRDFILDVHGRKLSYAVSANLTDKMVPGTFPLFVNTAGSIRILDAAGVVSPNATPAVTVTFTTAAACNPLPAPCTKPGAHYVIVDHGKDGGGAFSLEGVLTPCAAAGIDNDNCNNDGTFNDGYLTTPIGYVRKENGVAGAGHYDDYLYYTTTLSTDIWTKDASADILNNNSGNVKIGPVGGAGATTAQAAVDVRGNVEADALQANQLCDTSGNSYAAPNYTNNPCPTSTNNQFMPAILALVPGTVPGNGGITCAASGNAMRGIASANGECQDSAAPSGNLLGAACPLGSSCCPVGKGPVGIDVSGNVICQ